MRTTTVFDRTSSAYLTDFVRYVSSCGGTRSGKTISILQLLLLICIGEAKRKAAPTVNSVVSESMPHLKRGAIRDFKTILQSEGAWDDNAWSETDKVYTFSNGTVIEFFSVDNAGKVFGSARDRLFINEAQHIPWEVARQLFVRTRGVIFVDYNPTHSFWAQERIETKDNCIRIHSTYKDNEFLTKEQVREIEDNRNDRNWWKVFGEGQTGTLEGVVYDFDIIDELPDTSGMRDAMGLDFGFSNSITAICDCYVHEGRREIYLDERLYRKGVLNSDIAEFLRNDGVTRAKRIYCDAAEPKSIAELESYGFNVEACDKTSEADRHNPITAQITFLKKYRILVTKRSLNLIDELRGYVWDTDRNGERLNVPVKMRDHLCDAFRYACYTMLASTGGQYNISFNKPKRSYERRNRHY